MSNDKMREQLLEALEFIFMLADKQKQIDCSREYALIKSALSQQPESEPAWWLSPNGRDRTSDPDVVRKAAKFGHVWQPFYASPQPSAQVPTRKGEIQKDWWIEKAKHLLEKGAGYADVQRNNLAADEDACMDDDESALWRDLEIHSVNCRNLIDFNLTAAPSIAEKDQ